MKNEENKEKKGEKKKEKKKEEDEEEGDVKDDDDNNEEEEGDCELLLLLLLEGKGITIRIKNANQVKYCAVITLLNATKAYVCTSNHTGRLRGARV